MGLVASSARYSSLISQKFDLELAINEKNQLTNQLSRDALSIDQSVSGLDIDDPQYKSAQGRIKQLNLYEKMIEQQAAQIKQRIQAIDTEMQTLGQMVQKSIQSEFGYTLGGQ